MATPNWMNSYAAQHEYKTSEWLREYKRRITREQREAKLKRVFKK